MPFKQYVKAELAPGLDETYQFERWAADHPGASYFDVHVSVIEARETSVPTLRRVLAAPRLRILESGCGSGRWLAFFERLGHRAIGLDDSAGPLAVARAHAPALPLVRGDALAAPFRDGSFDVVFSAYVAEHFEDGPEAVLREIHRLLKPDGLLLLIVPYANAVRRLLLHPLLRAYYGLARWRGRGLAFTEYHFAAGELDALLARCGFRVGAVEPDDYRYPWAKGLSVDLGGWVAAPGGWELNRVGRLLARLLAVSPWAACAGILYVARPLPPSSAGAGRGEGDRDDRARRGGRSAEDV